MSVALVLPALNAAEFVWPLARALSRQTWAPSRLIVVDSSSTDGSRADWLAAGFEVLRIDRADFDHGGTRNLGARLAGDADILVFMTQDALPAHDEWLERLCAPIMRGEVAATYARQVARPGASPLEAFARSFNYPEASRRKTLQDLPALGLKTFFFSNVCSAVSSAAFRDVGGFPERVILNEDMVLAARLLRSGRAVGYVADAVVLHSHDYSLDRQFKRNFDIGASHADLEELRDLPYGGEGVRFMRGQLAALVRGGHARLAPYAVLEAAVKFAALQLGRRHARLPLSMKRRLSMHAYHWARRKEDS